MGSFGTHRRSVSIMFYILGLTLCSVFRATEIDRTVSRNTEEKEEEMEREEWGRGAEQEIVNIKMECCPISQMSSKCLESWRVMDEGEALVELRQKEGGLARANGEISWASLIAFGMRFAFRWWGSRACSAVQTVFFPRGWERGFKTAASLSEYAKWTRTASEARGGRRRGFFVFCGYRPRLRLPSSVIDS